MVALHMMLYYIYKESPHLFDIKPVALNLHHTTSNVYFKEPASYHIQCVFQRACIIPHPMCISKSTWPCKHLNNKSLENCQVWSAVNITLTYHKVAVKRVHYINKIIVI